MTQTWLDDIMEEADQTRKKIENIRFELDLVEERQHQLIKKIKDKKNGNDSG